LGISACVRSPLLSSSGSQMVEEISDRPQVFRDGAAVISLIALHRVPGGWVFWSGRWMTESCDRILAGGGGLASRSARASASNYGRHGPQNTIDRRRAARFMVACATAGLGGLFRRGGCQFRPRRERLADFDNSPTRSGWWRALPDCLGRHPRRFCDCEADLREDGRHPHRSPTPPTARWEASSEGRPWSSVPGPSAVRSQRAGGGLEFGFRPPTTPARDLPTARVSKSSASLRNVGLAPALPRSGAVPDLRLRASSRASVGIFP